MSIGYSSACKKAVDTSIEDIQSSSSPTINNNVLIVDNGKDNATVKEGYGGTINQKGFKNMTEMTTAKKFLPELRKVDNTRLQDITLWVSDATKAA